MRQFIIISIILTAFWATANAQEIMEAQAEIQFYLAEGDRELELLRKKVV